MSKVAIIYKSIQEFWNLEEKHFNPFSFILRTLIGITFPFLVNYVVVFCVFAIQSLIVGPSIYLSPSPICSKGIGKWLVVFGSLGVFSVIASLLTLKFLRTRKKFFVPIVCFSAVLGWLLYGVDQMYTGTNPTLSCTVTQYNTFRMIVLYLFWGLVALLSGFSLIFTGFRMIKKFMPPQVFKGEPYEFKKSDDRSNHWSDEQQITEEEKTEGDQTHHSHSLLQL